jgi:saccharopine dehydrogenase-like NADP-dependent oxidoreductase
LSDIYENDIDKKLDKYPNASFEFLDLRDRKGIVKLLKKAKPMVVINCAELDWNLDVYRACLETGVHVIDLGSDIPETKEQLLLGKFFKKNNLTAITGCGSTPGITNVMLNFAANFFDKIDTIEAGFAWDSNVKKFVAPFSIPTIIEEFTAPAQIVQNGRMTKKLPLENIIEREFREIAKQKCFFCHHPETYTFYIFCKNKGVKNVKFYAGFPDHSFEAIANFIEFGLGSKEKIMVEDIEVEPVKVLSQTLRKVEFPNGYEEKENLWVEIFGKNGQDKKNVLMECIVNTLPGWEDAGCNVDTGLPAAIIGEMVRDGRIAKRGSFTPESVVPVEEFFKKIKERKMDVYMDGALVN